ncbi:MAG: 2OG-Fe(II) oxygenase family protein [Actinomycetota bacterium]
MSADELVPTIDIADPSATDLAAVDRACRDHGFFLLRGHGLDDVVDRTWGEARRFFDSDRQLRTAVERDEENPLGWFDRELTKRRRDHKQVFDFIDPRSDADSFNRWPSAEAFPALRPTLTEFFDAFSDLADATASLVFTALGLAPDTHAAFRGDRSNSTVRLNLYPVGDPVPADERNGLVDLGETALGFHTDPGVLTLLLQDDTGGLQALAVDGGWVDIEPQAGTIVVNLADAMQVWTNDRYRAATHRVLTMTETDRMSIPYFSNPNRSAVIAPIPDVADGPARYREFAWRDHMRARTDDNFRDLGAADTQITDYLIDA